MLNNKFLTQSLILVILCSCYVVAASHSALHLTTTPNDGTNMFQTPRQTCSCIACACGGTTPCPQSVSAGGYLSFTAACASNQVVSGLNINVQSADTSTFKVYTMSSTEFTKYKAKGIFSYQVSGSVNTPITCTNMGSYSYAEQSMVVVVQCENILASCPLKYTVTSGCTTTGGGGGGSSGTVSAVSLSIPSTVNSGQTFTSTAKLVDSNGNTVAATGTATLSWDGSTGTLGGSTTSQFTNGIATFSNSITTSTAVYGTLTASYTSGGTTLSQGIGLKVNTGSTPVDYTSAWVGTWQVIEGCDTTTCCCLTGSVSVTKTNSNTVFLQSSVKGACGGQTSASASISNIDSDTTLKALILGNNFVLTRNGKELTVVNQQAQSCSGRATKTSGAPSLRNTISFIGLLIAITALLFV